jgi:hypothetical protein
VQGFDLRVSKNKILLINRLPPSNVFGQLAPHWQKRNAQIQQSKSFGDNRHAAG